MAILNYLKKKNFNFEKVLSKMLNMKCEKKECNYFFRGKEETILSYLVQKRTWAKRGR